MPRTTTPVDETLLRKAKEIAEKDGPLANLSILYQKTAEIYNALPKTDPKFINISQSVVGLRVKEYHMDTQTKAGKRGRPKGCSPVHRDNMGPRLSRAEKFNTAAIKESFAEIRRLAGPENENLVNKAEKGNLKAAVKLHCIGCQGYQRSEVAKCTAIGCPAWPFMVGIKKVDQVETAVV
jgi:hypothetical protein